MNNEVLEMDLELIIPPDDKQRDMIDPEKIRELAESIRSVGQMTPGLVRPAGGAFEIVYGHRRFLALRMIGETKMKVQVRELTDEEVYEMRAIENLQRVDLNPIERARVFQRWNQKYGLSSERIAVRVGLSKQSVLKYLALLRVPEEFQPAIAKRALAIETALTLMDVDDPEMRSYYMRAAIENGVTQDVARMWVDDWRKTKAGEYYGSVGGEGGQGAVLDRQPVYQTCFCCQGPEEVQRVQYVPLCKSCAEEVRGALKEKR